MQSVELSPCKKGILLLLPQMCNLIELVDSHAIVLELVFNRNALNEITEAVLTI